MTTVREKQGRGPQSQEDQPECQERGQRGDARAGSQKVDLGCGTGLEAVKAVT